MPDYAFIPSFPQANSAIFKVKIYKGVAYVCGQFSIIGGLPRAGFAAINPSTGAVLPLDLAPTLAGPGFVQDFVISNDIIYVCGNFVSPRNRAAAFDLSGNILPWDPNLNATALTITIDGSTVYIGGQFSTVNGGTVRRGIAAFDQIVGTVTAWDPDMNVGAITRGMLFVGSIVYVAGFFSTVNGGTTRNNAAAFDISTAVANAWDPDLNQESFSIETTSGLIYIGGIFTTANAGAFARTALVAVDPTTGAVYVPFDAGISGGSNFVRTVKYRNGKLVVAGSFDMAGGSATIGFAFLSVQDGSAIAPDLNVGGASANGLDLEFLGTRLFLVGDFTQFLGNTRRVNLAAYLLGTNTLRDLSIDIDGQINKVVVHHPSRIYVFGTFTSITGTNGTFARTGAACINDAGEVQTWNPVIAGGTVLTALVVGSAIYMGGTFTSVNATTRRRAAAVGFTTGTLTGWNPDFIGGSRHVDALLYDGTNIVIGGKFPDVNGGATTRNNICKVNPATGIADATWDPDVTGISNTVRGLAYDGTYIYIVGSFDTVGGATRYSVARVSATGTGAVDLTWVFDVDPGDTVLAATLDTGGALYIAGAFSNVNATPQSRFARINAGVLDSAWVNTLNTDVGASGVDILADGTTIYFAGDFMHVNGLFRAGIASADNTGVATAFAPNPGGTVLSMAIDQAALFLNTFYFAGLFGFVGVVEANNLAVLDIPAPPPTGLPQKPRISFLNRRTQAGLPSLTMFRWGQVSRDEQNVPTTILAYRVYRSLSKNLEDPTLIAEISTLDLAGGIDTLFVEEIDGFYRYCVSAVNSVGEGGKSCATFAETEQLERLG